MNADRQQRRIGALEVAVFCAEGAGLLAAVLRSWWVAALWAMVAGMQTFVARLWRLELRRRPVVMPCIDSLEGVHAWGNWSAPYRAAGRRDLWQERRCQCGNRDFRVAVHSR